MSAETPYPEELTCKPLKTFADIKMFLEDPPPWRTMCKELTPHSEFKLINMEVVKHNEQDEINEDDPEIFCHLSTQNQEAEDPKRHDGSKLPKTLVCHDMANGYHDDCLIDGSARYDQYTFYNWAGIDIFCYFSHHLITIPPLGWINVAHDHGVKVIGTVITEHVNGMFFWDKLLLSETEYQEFASALVAIAKTLKFEGWLLNIENKVSQPDVLLQFVRYLHRLLHEEIPHAELIWYDSVTVSGHLNWQNALNDKNRAYFDACDGIFTNYSWNEYDVERSARAAGARLTDLYVGIDVWGRNFFGGGEFSTQEAVKVVYGVGCSMAIFAQGWTHEAMSDDPKDINYVADGDQLDSWQRFLLRDRALWDSLWPFLYTRLPAHLPFRSAFCKGQGKKRRVYGEVISHGPWYNLRYQQYQPNSAHGPHGYALAPHDAILACSQLAILDHMGLIKITGAALPPTASVASAARRDSVSAALQLDPAPPDTPQEAPEAPSGVQRVKSLIRSIFSKHKEKKDEDTSTSTSTTSAPTYDKDTQVETITPEVDRKESEAGTSGARGKSMLTMSLNLMLGQGRATSGQRLGLVHVPGDAECLEVYQGDSFVGGSCLRVCEGRLVRLLHCDFACDSLVACVVTKTLASAPSQWLNVKLRARAPAGPGVEVCLVGRAMQAAGGARAPAAGGLLRLRPLPHDEQRFKQLQAHLLRHEPGFYVPVENPYGWSVRYYEVSLGGMRLMSVNLRTGLEQGGILLGLLGLCPAPAPPARAAAELSAAEDVAAPATIDLPAD